MKALKRLLCVLGCLAVVPVLLLRFSRPDPLPVFPRVMLWAWESPQDLRFVKPGDAGIAFLARTVWLNGKKVRSRPRLQPLRFTPGIDMMAVVRIESAGNGLPSPADLVREVLPAAGLMPEVRALEIDFDARHSERLWYIAFLRELRRAMPVSLPLTVTALESWCEERWVRDLPVADATPMLFRMGPGERSEPMDFPARICRSSVGVSTDELPARVPPARRIYFFHPGPWTREAYEAAVAQAWRWRR